MKLASCLSIVLIASLLVTLSEAGFRVRRRRRSCSASNCQVSAWSALWTTCTSRCGSTGVQSRTRSVTRPASCGGAACPPLKATRACNRLCHNGGTPAPGRCYCKSSLYRGTCCEIADGGWSGWRAWGRCPKTCGTAYHVRTRSCSNPSPSRGGRPCAGSNIERKLCSIKPCPVHGGWSPWTAWNTCSKTCGTGTQLRKRTCTNPRPSFGGRACPGPAVHGKTCKGAGTCMLITMLGCYENRWTTILKNFRSEMDWTPKSFRLVVEGCAKLAKQKKYRFFAIRYFSQCVVDISKRYDYARLQPASCVNNVGTHNSMAVYIGI